MSDRVFPGESPEAVAHLRPSSDRYTATIPEDRGDVLDPILDELLTQYREAFNLQTVIRNILERLDDIRLVAEELPTFFDVLDARGDQLTILGKWLGWPRHHRKGALAPIFGYAPTPSGSCDDDCYDGPPVAGWCTGSWGGCANTEYVPYVFADDEVYRGFLLSRIAQLFGDFRRRTLTACVQIVYGPAAFILREGAGSITISIGRPFAGEERATRHLVRQVLPVAPGVEVNIVSQPANTRVFGYGRGWGEWCNGIWK